MLEFIPRKIHSIWMKNNAEFRAMLFGRMPRFIFASDFKNIEGEIPVFVFHSIKPEQFERQLQFLKINGYQTLDADGLEAVVRQEETIDRAVALTFDDATWTFWTYAFPLLKKYKFNAILFAIPGLVPDELNMFDNLDSVWAGKTHLDELKQRGKLQPLCSWHELSIMHKSGFVDIQSHSLTHCLVPISTRIVDYHHPGFDTDYYGNVKVPLSSSDNPDKPNRQLRYGAPVFKSTSRMSSIPRFIEPPELTNKLVSFVQSNGGDNFFKNKRWKKQLDALSQKINFGEFGRYETKKEMKRAVRREFVESKEVLERRLNSKKITQFCYPWFSGSDFADESAQQAGYTALHYGLDVCRPGSMNKNKPVKIRRLSEEYLLALPGNKRITIFSIWFDRIRRSFLKKRFY